MEVRSLLFLPGANADFTEGFTQAIAPLRKRIREGVKYQWTPDCQKVIEQVKTVMAYFDPQHQTELKVDVGPQGVAATMKQFTQAKRWRPVTYHSRALTDTEMSQSVSQRRKQMLSAKEGSKCCRVGCVRQSDLFVWTPGLISH